MRILLGSNALYHPAHGGGERSNRMLIEGLSGRGHKCFVVTRIDRFGDDGEQKLRTQLEQRGIRARREPGALRYELNGVEVLTATSAPSFRAFFVEHKNWFRPDVIITSTDDPAQLLLEAALHDDRAPTVFLTRATVALPFGPDGAFPSREKTEMLQHADGIVGVSNYVARYIREHSGLEATHVPIALPEPGPHPLVGRFDNEFVTLANPCAVKGIAIFLELARLMPHLRFAGVPTWGTTPEDAEMMRSIPNIAIVPKVDEINTLLERTRVLLVPSVWAEARSRIVVEAMLAGVPVMASNLGGLPEAKMDVPYILPVTPIEGYEQRLNEQFVPVAEVPPQNIEPWQRALDRLTTDRQHWEELSRLSRETALHFAETTTVEPFEQYVTSLKRKPRHFSTQHIRMPSDQMARLSPERRRLLELKLQKQAAAVQSNPALPFGGMNTSRLRLFCFPHAGGGASVFRKWRGRVGDRADVAAVLYPGRENRRSEPFARSVQELVQSLLTSLRPALQGEFVFFGHSMGAVVAFELIRALRREESVLPKILIASGARAPQFRRNHKPGPDPPREDLLEEIRRLGGMPPEAMEDPSLLDTVLPALEADTALYRRFSYQPEARLDLPIVALSGEDDRQISAEHLSAWREQTSAGFSLHRFPGGHFYLRTKQDEILSFLRSVLSEV